MEAMFQLRDTKPEIVDSPTAVDYNPSTDGATIEFDNLEFAYKTSPPNADAVSSTSTSASSSLLSSTNGKTYVLHEEQIPSTRPILQKTTFTIPQGKTIAIVGSSGCGKSTLLRMLYRFYSVS